MRFSLQHHAGRHADPRSRKQLAAVYGEIGVLARPGSTWIIPHIDLVNRSQVEEIHAKQSTVMVWTANGSENMRELAGWGVDAIISDETELLVHTLRSRAPHLP